MIIGNGQNLSSSLRQNSERAKDPLMILMEIIQKMKDNKIKADTVFDAVPQEYLTQIIPYFYLMEDSYNIKQSLRNESLISSNLDENPLSGDNEVDLDNRWSVIALAIQAYGKIYDQQIEHLYKQVRGLRRQAYLESDRQEKDNNKKRQEDKEKEGKDQDSESEAKEEFKFIDPETIDIEKYVKHLEAPQQQKKDAQGVQSTPLQINFESFIDPFFKKTSQMFDEANASGLLLNNLAVSKYAMISLDAEIYKENDDREFVDAKAYQRTIKGLVQQPFKDLLSTYDMSEQLRDFIQDMKEDLTRQVSNGYIDERSRLNKFVNGIAKQFQNKPLREIERINRDGSLPGRDDQVSAYQFQEDTNPLLDLNDFNNYDPGNMLDLQLDQEDFLMDDQLMAQQNQVRQSRRQVATRRAGTATAFENNFGQPGQIATTKSRRNTSKRLRAIDADQLVNLFNSIQTNKPLHRQLQEQIKIPKNEIFCPVNLPEVPETFEEKQLYRFREISDNLQSRSRTMNMPNQQKVKDLMSEKVEEYLDKVSTQFSTKYRNGKEINEPSPSRRSLSQSDFGMNKNQEDDQQSVMGSEQSELDLIVNNDLNDEFQGFGDDQDFQDYQPGGEDFYDQDQENSHSKKLSQNEGSLPKNQDQQDQNNYDNQSDEELNVLFKDNEDYQDVDQLDFVDPTSVNYNSEQLQAQNKNKKLPLRFIKQESNQEQNLGVAKRQRNFGENDGDATPLSKPPQPRRRFRANILNIRRIKQTMNQIIEQEQETLNFSEVCEKTQTYIEEQDEVNVSIQTNFLCLLHLANEKSFDLDQMIKMNGMAGPGQGQGDIIINPQI
eukprot:403333536